MKYRIYGHCKTIQAGSRLERRRLRHIKSLLKSMNNYQHLGYYNALRWSSIAVCLQNIAGWEIGGGKEIKTKHLKLPILQKRA